MQSIDLYTGFEGEREVILREKDLSNDDITFEVELWSGYFNRVISLLPFNSSSHPDSIVYKYHVTDFGDDEDECQRIDEFYDQLDVIGGTVPSDLVDAYNAIKQITLSAIQHGNKLFYLYD